MQIKRYKDFSSVSVKKEENLMEQKEYFRIIESIEMHIDAMILEGKTDDQINESFFGEIFSFLGGGFKNTLYTYAADWLLTKLGLPGKDERGENTFWREWAIQTIASLKWSQITSYFGKGACKPWTKAIQEGLSKTVLQKGAEFILRSINQDPASLSGPVQALVRSVSGGIGEYINSTSFAQKIEESISGLFCGEGKGLSFSEIFKGKTLDPQNKKELISGYHQAAKDNPELVGQAKKIGWLDTLLGKA
jgi:hypothetical protein